MGQFRRPLPLVTRSVPRMCVRPGNTVFLIQDMQRFLTEPEVGLAAVADHRGISPEFDEYFEQAAAAAANIARLRGELTALGIPIYHTRWTQGRAAERTPLHRALDFLPEAGDGAAEIVAPLAPETEADVFSKPGLGAFSSAALCVALTERRVENLILCGVMTEFGIQATAFQAMDLGYRPLIVGDCCAAMTRFVHNITLDGLGFGTAKIRPWQELCYNLEALNHDDVAVL